MLHPREKKAMWNVYFLEHYIKDKERSIRAAVAGSRRGAVTVRSGRKRRAVWRGLERCDDERVSCPQEMAQPADAC